LIHNKDHPFLVVEKSVGFSPTGKDLYFLFRHYLGGLLAFLANQFFKFYTQVFVKSFESATLFAKK